MGKRAVVLASGGVDSTTCMAIAMSEGYEVYALSFDYGQRHRYELRCAANAAERMGAAGHKVIEVDLRAFGGSSLTDEMEVPKDTPEAEIGAEIPSTYVPARNTVFLSLALAWAEVLGAEDIFIGVNALDYSGYPDCRPEYIAAFEKMANLATKAGVEGTAVIRIRTPLIQMSKADIIRKGVELGVDFARTHSCYDPDEQGRSCGRCDSCLLRLKGFRDAGIEDPAPYS
jgi:7-cyano-7-deazaguanine synthase